MKTQILITDIPRDAFTSNWPNELRSKLFSIKFPQYFKLLNYFTPLAFMNRIILILDTEYAANDIYNFLQNEKTNKNDKYLNSSKLFLTESLITKPRSNSTPTLSNTTTTTTSTNKQEETPVLSIDTNPHSTGINKNSLERGSISLSPDSSSLMSPTLLSMEGNDTKRYYMEPKPDSRKQSVSEDEDVVSKTHTLKSPTITFVEL